MQTATQMLNDNQQMMNRLELQVSQMAKQIGERDIRTFPSQPVANPRSAPSSSAQVNATHTLRFEKKVNNQVVMPDQIVSSPPKVVLSSCSNKSV